MTVEAGVVTLAAFISPLAEDRAKVHSIVGAASLFEVYVRCPLDVCETRDVKGLYKKVRRGEIDNFTGISAPYEAPDSADLVLDTGVMPAAACVAILLQRLQSRMALP